MAEPHIHTPEHDPVTRRTLADICTASWWRRILPREPDWWRRVFREPWEKPNEAQ